MKNILITGATDGIGKLAAMQLANEGHAIYIHGRNATKVDDTVQEIKHATQNVNVSGFVADFSNIEDVKAMVKTVSSELDTLDVLINNAGVFKSPHLFNDDGVDLRFVVNYLAPYVLTHGLTELLNKSKNPRIVNLSSAAQSDISYEAVLGKVQANLNATYAYSKLALTMWNNRFAQAHPNIVSIAVNPGSLLNTKMANEAYGQHWSPADKGANIIVDLALGEEHQTMSGRYFDNDAGRYAEAHPWAYDANEINRLQDITEQLLD